MFSATLEGEKMGLFASALLNSGNTNKSRLGEYFSKTVPQSNSTVAYPSRQREHKEAILKHLLMKSV